MRQTSKYLFAVTALALFAAVCTVSFGGNEEKPKDFKVHPIGPLGQQDLAWTHTETTTSLQW